MISSFEYVIVIMSIILGLGITQILSGIAKMIQKREKVVVYWPHMMWVAFILFLHIQEWWVMYELKTFFPWRLPVFLFIMLYPITLYIMAKVIFPDRWNVRKIDLREYYLQNYQKFFVLLIVSALLSVVYNILFLKMDFSEQGVQFVIVFSFGILVYKNSLREALHKLISFTIAFMVCLVLLVEWNKWLIN